MCGVEMDGRGVVKETVLAELMYIQLYYGHVRAMRQIRA